MMRPLYKTRNIINKKQIVIATSACLMLLLSACESGQQQGGQMPDPEVSVHVISATNAQLTTELPGRTSPFATAEVRPQVNGILLKRLFTEGSYVSKGQALYQIDPATYQAAFDRAQAAYEAARLMYERYNELIKTNAISQQQYDDAYSQYLQTKAAMTSARIDLGYTKIVAPITGRIGRSSVTQGALLTAYQGNPLATIQQMDPIYVDIPQSSTALLRLQHEMANGKLTRTGGDQIEVTLTLENGQPYEHTGRMQFSEVTVDEKTNTVTLRALFPNPEGQLLPGMFVRAQLKEGIRENAILVPQKAISRNMAGDASALVVNKDNKVEARQVVTSRTLGNQWIIDSGLKVGDRVIVEGLQQAKPGATVRIAQNEKKPQADQKAPTADNQGSASGAASAQPTADNGTSEQARPAAQVQPAAANQNDASK